MKSRIIIEDDKVVYETVNNDTVVSSQTTTLNDFFINFSSSASIDTGIMPTTGTGVISVRSALKYTQVAYQHEPGVYPINWGSYEHDSSAETFFLAQPWRIVIFDLQDHKLLGSRTFYSMSPIVSGDEQLYHVNLPNLNCQGYGSGNGLGWLCLYHRNDDIHSNFNSNLNHVISRSSGIETYNDANMSETDGPRFYEQEYRKTHPNDYNDYSYLWGPALWQKKSQAEGFDWTLNPQLWLRVYCDDVDHQGHHVDLEKGGIPLTFNRALYGNYSAYYGDKNSSTFKSKNNTNYTDVDLKPFNLISRSNETLDDSKIFLTFKAAAISKSTDVAQLWGNQNRFDFTSDPFNDPVDISSPCPVCNMLVAEYTLKETDDRCSHDRVCSNCYDSLYTTCNFPQGCKTKIYSETAPFVEGIGHLCDSCSAKIDFCTVCNKGTVSGDGSLHSLDGELKCFDCSPCWKCQACGSLHKNPNNVIENHLGSFCTACGIKAHCAVCESVMNDNDSVIVAKNIDFAFSPLLSDDQETVKLCHNCSEDHGTCSCGNYLHKSLIETYENTVLTTCPLCSDIKTISFDQLITNQ